MAVMRNLALALASLTGVLASPVPLADTTIITTTTADSRAVTPGNTSTALRSNDFSCRSSSHPSPVVLLHGLGASEQIDLNFLEVWLRARGFCTFALTYGSYAPYVPILGGLKPIAESSLEIASFVREVQARTGAAKVDLVGHSEGGFQALYTPKLGGLAASDVGRVVAIAPPTHGTSFAGLYNLAYVFGSGSREAVGAVLRAVGCAACDDLGPDGGAVRRLSGDGRPIAQPGQAVTVITSRADELVTPTRTSFVDEPGVHNIYVQDYCPLDPVGHIGEAVDVNVWNLVLNALEDKTGRKFVCLAGPPGR
ncbi:hypothetical protein PCL_02809 [Purpureocillium lilacinum]|uniref:Lipase class 2 n=1 Tax=Purpureocillium lilacinum TaxID=33203 RepID=A0A179GWF6_PURLI|nr:lipase class 2 [Purpureocillium lilacinum]PWI67455.1 hypothetical protein PCL_02809 [Purpureocillium lilacinum]